MSSDPESAPKPQAPVVIEKLRRLPSSASEDFVAFRDRGDEQALTRLIIAVLVDHAPDKSRAALEWKAETKLVEDVGFDSLSIAETVFFFEDLFQISISNEEILQLRSFGDLQDFVKKKAGGAGN